MKNLIFIFVLLFFSACFDTSYSLVPTYGVSKPSTNATMRPYRVNGKTYYPSRVNIGDVETGVASWYGPGFHGKQTSNGERFNTNSLTAAHKTLPMNTMVKVDNLENGKSVIVRINDRGPFVAGRIIDLSNRAAKEIDMTKKGTAKVRLSVVGFNSSINYNKNPHKEISNIDYVSGGEFMIQIGAFKAKNNAYNFANKYKNYQGYNSRVIDSADGIYRVFLAGFKSEDEARDFIKLAHFIGSFIFRE